MKKHTKVERDRLIFTGEVIKNHRGGLFEIKVIMGNSETVVLATACGKIKQNLIKIIVGDKVKIEVSPLDVTRGRIVERLRS